MADEPDNLTLQLLREIRAEVGDVKRDLGTLQTRVERIEGDIADLRQSHSMLVGLVTEARWREDRHHRDLTMLHNRVTALEVTVGAGPEA